MEPRTKRTTFSARKLIIESKTHSDQRSKTVPDPGSDGTAPVTRTRQRMICLSQSHMSSDSAVNPNTAPNKSWGGNSATRIMNEASETLGRSFLGGITTDLRIEWS